MPYMLGKPSIKENVYFQTLHDSHPNWGNLVLFFLDVNTGDDNDGCYDNYDGDDGNFGNNDAKKYQYDYF